MNKPEAVQSTSRTVHVYERLRASILAGELKPSAKIKINEICAAWQVSLGAVREALSRLNAEGLVILTPQKGAQVAPISREDLLDLTRVRIELETVALRESIARGGLVWETRVVAAYHRLSRLRQNEPNSSGEMTYDWADAHSEFHLALVSACISPWLLRLRKLLYDQSERYRRLSAPASVSTRDVPAEHAALMEAAMARDSDLACELLERHLNTTAQVLLDSTGFVEALGTGARGKAKRVDVQPA